MGIRYTSDATGRLVVSRGGVGGAAELVEHEEMLYQVVRGFLNGGQRRNGAVGPYLQYQPLPVGLRADHHRLHRVFHLADRVVDGVHRQHAHRQAAQVVVLLGALVALARLHVELDGQVHVGVVQGRQVQFRVDNLVVAGGGDVPGADPALAHNVQPHFAGAFGQGVDANALDAQEQVHHLLLDAGNYGVFVGHPVYLDPSDRGALNRAEEQATQGVAHRGGEAPLQRLQGDAGVGIGAFQHPDGRAGDFRFGFPQRRENLRI